MSRETRALNPLWLIILVTLLVFANAIQAPFVWEDKELVLENRFIRSFSSAKFFFLPSYWRECHVAPGMAYKPVTMWSYALDFQLWGLRPWGYHLTNVALHAANALLIFALARGLKLGGSAALATTLLFAVHPLHTETVDWVKNRADLLSTLFLLAALVLFVRWRPPDGASRGALSYWASLAAFALAAMSKGAGLALCPVLAFYVLLFLPRRDWRTALAATAPFWALAVAYLVNLAFLMQCRLQLTVMTGASETGVTGVLGAVAGYLQLLALPVRLAADRASAAELSLAPGTLAALALATALACLAACRGQRRAVLFMLAWVVVSLAPAAYAAVMGSRPMAEQRLQLSLGGLCALLALAVTIPGAARRSRLLVAVLALLFTTGTIQRHFIWRDEDALWRDAIIKSPRLPRPYTMLGDSYTARGLLRRAVAASRRALAIRPDYARAHNTLGYALAQSGDLDGAASAFQRAIEANPAHSAAHSNLGSICFQKGDLESAVRHWQAALEIDPGHIRSHQNLGGAFEKLGRLEEAAHEYRQAIGLSPANDAALFCSIARVLRRLGQTDQAAAYYRRSLAAVPGYPPAQQGLAELRPQNPLRPVPHPQGGFP